MTEPTPPATSVRISATADLHFGRHPIDSYSPVLSAAVVDATTFATMDE